LSSVVLQRKKLNSKRKEGERESNNGEGEGKDGI
jgi:hypothetical protein